MAFIGLIPAGVGLAFLIYYFIEGRNELADYKARVAAREAARDGAHGLGAKTSTEPPRAAWREAGRPASRRQTADDWLRPPLRRK